MIKSLEFKGKKAVAYAVKFAVVFYEV